jgi:hypothetical protein
MASPFSIFRKRQKLMLALLGILAMFGFVILPTMLDTQDSQAHEDPLVVRTRHGDLHRSQIDGLIRTRISANNFMSALTFVPEFFGGASDEGVVRTYLMARKAREAGLVISNEAINSFLTQITRGQVKQEGMLEVLQQQHMSEEMLFEALRTELLAMRYGQLLEQAPQGFTMAHFYLSFQEPMSAGDRLGVPPAARWEYFLRLKRKAKVEAIPIEVASFLDQVAEPSDADLQAFFDEHKNKFPVTGSPEPGFRVPAKAQFQYLRADYEKFFDEAKAAITDEEIAAYYEEHKSDFVELALPDDGADEPADVGGSPLPTREDLPPPPLEEASAPTDDPGTNPADDAGDADADDAEDAAAEGDAAGGDETDDAEDAPANNESDERSEADAELDAAFDEAVEEALGEEVSEEPAPDDEATDQEDDAGAAEVDEPAATEESTSEPTDAGDDEPAAPGPAGEVDAEEAETPAPPPTYKPLEEVADLIRTRLAGPKAVERMEKLLEDIKGDLDQYYADLAASKVASDIQVPDRPDFAQLADEHGLSAQETALLTAEDVQSTTDLGASTTPGNAPFVEFAYTSLQPFKPAISSDNAGNKYLYWKIAEEKEFVPDLADEGTRRHVVRTWKMIQARDLARKRAEELAAMAREGNKPLAEVVSTLPDPQPLVVESDAFPWLSEGIPGAERRGPTISEVTGIDQAGEEFMQTVFGLEENEVGVALNHSQTVAYVVRVLRFQPPRKSLEIVFLADMRSRKRDYQGAAVNDVQQMSEAWVKQLEADANVEWVEQPQQVAER